METAGVDVVVEEFTRSQPGGEQYLQSPTEGADPVARLRSDLQRLRDSLDAIDRRDAAQHGGLKGEIAHLVRRIARLEALPKVRQAR